MAVQERQITEAEREFALRNYAHGAPGISFRKEAALGFVFGAILGALVSFGLAWTALPFMSVNSRFIELTVSSIGALICGVLGSISALRTARNNKSSAMKQRDHVLAELDIGRVVEYHGSVKTAYFNRKANPEHPDLHIVLDDDNEFILTLQEQCEHDIHSFPKSHFTITLLPKSKLVVQAGGD